MAEGDTDRKLRTHEILQAAQEAFARHGYKKTTIEDIADRLGMVKSALYYYYRNKQELFIAVLEHEVNLFFTKVRGLLSSANTVEGKLIVYASHSNKFHQDFHNLYNLTVDELFQNFEDLMRIRNIFLNQNIQLIMEVLESDAGNPVMPPSRAARLFMDMLGGVLQSYHLEKQTVPEKDLMAFISIFYRGLYR